jgi:nitronate monooxygenase
MGADLAYSGTRFIATEEARALPDYKEMIVESAAKDIVYSSLFTGIHGNYLGGSIARAGMDPTRLPDGSKTDMDFDKASELESKVWKDIWGAGQGVGNIEDILPARDVVMRMEQEYRDALARVNAT